MYAEFHILQADGSWHVFTGPNFTSDRARYYHHVAMHCPRTNQIWACVEYKGDTRERLWYPYRRCCEGQKGWHSLDTPGTLVGELTDLFTLPYALLVREFHLHDKRIENGESRPWPEATKDSNSLDQQQDEEEAQRVRAPFTFQGIETAV